MYSKPHKLYTLKLKHSLVALKIMLNKIKCLQELVMPPKMITFANTGNIYLTRSHVHIIMSQLVIISQTLSKPSTTLYQENMYGIQ